MAPTRDGQSAQADFAMFQRRIHSLLVLALEITGHPLSDLAGGPVTWGIWMKRA